MNRDRAQEIASREAEVRDVMIEAVGFAGFVRAVSDKDDWWRRPGSSPMRLALAFSVAIGEARAVLQTPCEVAP
jgi:hypothetical protein